MSRVELAGSLSGLSDRREPSRKAADRRCGRARVFFALWPQPALARRLHELACATQAETGGRVMRRDTLHQTLAFVGDVSRERIPELVAVGRAQPCAQFDFQLDLICRWPRNRIIWAGTSAPPPAMVELATSLAGRLIDAGFRLEARDFVPHVTLVRNSARAPASLGMASLRWRVDEFVLVESIRSGKGAHYRIVERFGAVNDTTGP